MRSRVLMLFAFTAMIVAPWRILRSQMAPACYATPTSMTPAQWRSPATVTHGQPARGLKLVREIALPGPGSRFDYQSLDPTTGRIYMNHMDAGRTLVFNVDSNRVLAEVTNVPRATGVLAVPSRHQVYISSAGLHAEVVVDDRTLQVVSRVEGIAFPDGIAYASESGRIFVSDESGQSDVVIDARTGTKLATIPLGGEAGNTHYDSVSHCILVAVQTRNQLAAIDPSSGAVIQRYSLAGALRPHGFAIDEADRLAFVSCEGNATLIVLDLRTMKEIQQLTVADDPDVLAWDPRWQRLYVATESGVLSAFWLAQGNLRPLGEIHAPHAHTVSVDPRTHLVYLPLENIDGHPVLRVYQPAAP